MKHCIYAAQQTKPIVVAGYIGIMNGFQLALSEKPVPAGTLINQPFPEDADIRWFETPFLSTDPSSPDFLKPDWADTNVQKYIVDQGWADDGVRDADGTIADLGAIPYGGRPTDVIQLTPTSPVMIHGTDANFSFTVSAPLGKFTNPRIKYFRWISNVEFSANAFGNNAPVVPANEIIDIPIPAKTVSMSAANFFEVSVPARTPDQFFGFFEIILEGTGASGTTIASSVGFMPYRKLDYHIIIEASDMKGDSLDTVMAGDTVKLVFTPEKDGNRFTSALETVDVSLNSGAVLWDEMLRPFAISDGIDGGYASTRAVFTTVPCCDGVEYIRASGIWVNPNDSAQTIPFFGVSKGITVMPGPPAGVIFEVPSSNHLGMAPTIINEGSTLSGQLFIHDRFQNKVHQCVAVLLSNLDSLIGGCVGGAQTITTDSLGVGRFSVEVTNGLLDEVFRIRAALPSGYADTASVQVCPASAVSRPGKPVVFPIDCRRISLVVFDLRGRVVMTIERTSFSRHFNLQEYFTHGKSRVCPGIYIIRAKLTDALSSRTVQYDFKELIR